MHLCPHCGYNLEQDKPIAIGHWTLFQDAAYLHGARVALSKAQAGILHSVAKAAPRTVTAEVLAQRSGSDAGNVRKCISTQMSYIRRKLGPAMPIETQWGVGYRWAA